MRLEEIVLKCAEFGVLGVIVLLLLTRGITALNSLTQSQTVLAESINRLYKEVAVIDNRVDTIDREIKQMKLTLEEIKHCLQLRMFLKPDVVDKVADR